MEDSEKGTLELFSENAQSKSVSSETRKEKEKRLQGDLVETTWGGWPSCPSGGGGPKRPRGNPGSIRRAQICIFLSTSYGNMETWILGGW